MSSENNNKIKLLKLLEILRKETDEEYAISRQDLLLKLRNEGITCDIRTLSVYSDNLVHAARRL